MRKKGDSVERSASNNGGGENHMARPALLARGLIVWTGSVPASIAELFERSSRSVSDATAFNAWIVPSRS